MRTWRVVRIWRGVEAPSAVDAIGASKQRFQLDEIRVHRDIDDLETRRRDFMSDEPELYAYIEARIAARELKRAGGDASGAIDNYGAANRVWALSGRWEQKWREMIEPSTSTPNASAEPG